MNYNIYNFTSKNNDFGSLETLLRTKHCEPLHSFSNEGQLTLIVKNDLSALNKEIVELGYMTAEPQSNIIITLINRSIASNQLIKVLEELNTLGLRLSSIQRLSGDRQTKEGIKTCYELQAQTSESLSELRAKLKNVIETLQIDICVIPADTKRQEIKLAVFDMDSTLIQCECIDELAKRHNIGDQVSSITAAAMRGELNFNESFTQRMALLEGLSEDVLLDIGENLPLTEGVEYLIKKLKEHGYKIALFSGGFYYFANILKAKLGIDHVYANNLPIHNGSVTGQVEGVIVDGQKKKERLKHVAELEGLKLSQTVAVGDGANDLPMIGLAGLGVAFHAKPLVREQAGLAVSTVGLDGLLYILGIRD